MGNCCGQKRTAWNKTIADKPNELNKSMHLGNFTNKPAKRSSKLKYIGDASLTLRGNVSRKIYTFSSPHIILDIETEDLNLIASNPFLIKVL